MAEASTVDATEESSITQTIDLLRSNDDTSRFVGFTTLNYLLERDAIQRDSEKVLRLWTAIPGKFLNRMLNAGDNSKYPKETSQSMVEIAVFVIHRFLLLSPALQDSEKCTERCPALVGALLKWLVDP
jgi:Neurochondrin